MMKQRISIFLLFTILLSANGYAQKGIMRLTQQTLMHDAEEKFKDLGWVEEKLTKGFKRLKKEVPTLFVPHFYAQIAVPAHL